jgi:hypothetical protein
MQFHCAADATQHLRAKLRRRAMLERIAINVIGYAAGAFALSLAIIVAL